MYLQIKEITMIHSKTLLGLCLSAAFSVGVNAAQAQELSRSDYTTTKGCIQNAFEKFLGKKTDINAAKQDEKGYFQAYEVIESPPKYESFSNMFISFLESAKNSDRVYIKDIELFAADGLDIKVKGMQAYFNQSFSIVSYGFNTSGISGNNIGSPKKDLSQTAKRVDEYLRSCDWLVG